MQNKIIKQKQFWISIVLPTVLLALFFYLMTMNHVYSKTYDDIEKFDRANETIRSPITIENEAETDRKMRETVLAVGDRYTTVEEITEEQLSYVEEIFDGVQTTLENAQKKDPEEQISNDEIIIHLREILSTEITNRFDEVFFLRLIRLDDEAREQGKQLFIKSANSVLEKGVRIENIHSAKEEVRASIKYSRLEDDVKEVLYDLIDFTIVENSIFDVEKTLEARKEAANNVQPVIIRSGDIIVREGQVITNEVYEELKLVGLLNNERNIFPGIGLVIFMLLLLTMIGYEFYRLYRKNEWNKQRIIAIFIISILVVTLMKVVSLIPSTLNQLYFLVPIAAGVLLIKLLIYERISIIFALVFSIIASLLFNDFIPGALNMEAGLYFLFFQVAGIISVTNVKDRLTLLKAAFSMVLVNVMTITMFIFLSFEKFQMIELLKHAAFGAGAALLSSILAIGLLPYFETFLGILSDNKLLALANPNQPLLKKILTEAPGTYHHSVMVANLSESACEAIGANGLLARVASYYHDIGKTIKPHYFIENQVGIRNPHDFIEPKQSAKIIIGHVTEGAKLLEKHNFPKEIIDITLQHHGTSLVEYFYHLEKQQHEDVSEDDFRYPGPKPQTKEAGIVSICDAAEAAVRSLNEPTNDKIEEIVGNIVRNKLLEGQLDETPLTLEELETIKNTVCEALKGIFHSRIQYPSEEAN